MLRLNDIKDSIFTEDGEFISEYYKHVYSALFFSELSEKRLEQAMELRQRIDSMEEEYSRVLSEADEYAEKSMVALDLAKQYEGE